MAKSNKRISQEKTRANKKNHYRDLAAWCHQFILNHTTPWISPCWQFSFKGTNHHRAYEEGGFKCIQRPVVQIYKTPTDEFHFHKLQKHSDSTASNRRNLHKVILGLSANKVFQQKTSVDDALRFYREHYTYSKDRLSKADRKLLVKIQPVFGAQKVDIPDVKLRKVSPNPTKTTLKGVSSFKGVNRTKKHVPETVPNSEEEEESTRSPLAKANKQKVNNEAKTKNTTPTSNNEVAEKTTRKSVKPKKKIVKKKFIVPRPVTKKPIVNSAVPISVLRLGAEEMIAQPKFPSLSNFNFHSSKLTRVNLNMRMNSYINSTSMYQGKGGPKPPQNMSSPEMPFINNSLRHCQHGYTPLWNSWQRPINSDANRNDVHVPLLQHNGVLSQPESRSLQYAIRLLNQYT